ncbi:MAG TPA: 30S ribosomal protein S16 [Thermoanaerobaculaceae bacterium]|nr:30S ribosomal protein S16 [Thermoanaerobaculaceae bacterium]HRS15957.1 30S ribosomal protein S16 [Thermoanaerobaculaceae bacterium]
MLMIRLRRMGSNRRPVYRVVVSDGRRTPTAAVLEEVGFYNPRSNPAEVTLDRERIAYWLGRGAQMSETVASLVSQSAN